MSPSRRRRAVHMLQERLGLSQRRACQIVGQHRSTQRHIPVDLDPDQGLRRWLRRFAKKHPRWGYRRAHRVAVREGWEVNRKRIQRLWREEGLRVPQKRRKRQRLGESTTPAERLQAEYPDHVWALDYQFDVTATGRTIKILHVVDEHTRESLSDLVAYSIDADATVGVLDKIVGQRGTHPEFIRCDNGPELTAAALRDWCRFTGAGTAYIDPGAPWQNPWVESYGSRIVSRREGRVFRRCRACGHLATTPARACECVHESDAVCGGELGWGFAIDVAPPGARRRKRFTRSGYATKKEALAALREVQQADASGSLVEPSRITVGEYLDDWLAAARSRIGDDLSATGWRDYEVHVRRHITPGIGDVPLQALDRNQVKALYAWVQEGNSSRLGRRPSPKTVHNIHLTLHRALEDAVVDGLIPRNPASGARKAPKRRPEMLTWDEDQLRRFLKVTEQDRLFPVWRLTAMSGMRRGEVLGLRWDDLDERASTLTLKRQWKRGERGLVLAPPKTDQGRRTIDIDAETVTVLKRWRRAQLEERMAYDGDWQDSGFMFTRNDGRPHDVDVVSQRFDRLVARAGLPPVRYHDLRHTHATLLLLSGVPPHVVSLRLGHRSVAFTLQQYAHVLPQQQADAVARLAARLATPRRKRDSSQSEE